MIIHVFTSFSTVQIYDVSYIHLHSSPSNQLPVNFIAGIAEVMALNPGLKPKYFLQALFSQLFKFARNCDDHSCLDMKN